MSCCPQGRCVGPWAHTPVHMPLTFSLHCGCGWWFVHQQQLWQVTRESGWGSEAWSCSSSRVKDSAVTSGRTNVQELNESFYCWTADSFFKKWLSLVYFVLSHCSDSWFSTRKWVTLKLKLLRNTESCLLLLLNDKLTLKHNQTCYVREILTVFLMLINTKPITQHSVTSLINIAYGINTDDDKQWCMRWRRSLDLWVAAQEMMRLIINDCLSKYDQYDCSWSSLWYWSVQISSNIT